MYRTVVIAALLLSVVAGAACGDDDDDGGEGRAQRSTTTASSVEADVEAAYLAYWDMTVRLQQAPNPDDAEIHEWATGHAAEQLVDGLASLRRQSHVVVFGDQYSHRVISVDASADAASLRDCFVDDAVTLDRATNEEVSGGLASGIFAASLRLVDGQWRVTELELESAEEGVEGCAG